MISACMTVAESGCFEFIDGAVNAEKYQQILQNSLLPSIAKFNIGANYIFEQGGATCHTTKTWLSDHNVIILSWPFKNVIETL